MDVSFILSGDEIFTLMGLFSGHTEVGERFAAGALVGAEICDLSSLVEKKLAKRVGDSLEIEPVVRMVADAMARADSATNKDDKWEIDSPWISLQCEQYPYQANHWKITPLQRS